MSYTRLVWLAAFALLGACNRAPESGITAVEAHIDGITCPTCVPPLETSLRRQYGKSSIEVSDEKDTATIRFAKGDDFSPSQFRAAVERVRMKVVSMHVQACGALRADNGATVLVAGANRFVARSSQPLPVGKSICADGTLDMRSDPATFQITSLRDDQ